MHPAAGCVGSIENDLEDAAKLTGPRRLAMGVLELLEQKLDDPIEFASFACREMVEISLHCVDVA
jgi:hypothetical protein